MDQQARWKQRLGDLKEAANRLNDALAKDILSELERDGVIQRFEFTFELTRKTLKDYLEDQGFAEVSSPKKALQEAFQQNLIEDGEAWMKMLEDRNKMSHLYDKEASELIFQNIKNDYSGAIKNLVAKLAQRQ